MATTVKNRANSLAKERCKTIDHFETMKLLLSLELAKLSVLEVAEAKLAPLEPFVKNVLEKSTMAGKL